MPLQTMPTSYCFEKIRSKKTTVTPPTPAERVVHIAARAMMVPYPAGVMPRVEPWRRQKRGGSSQPAEGGGGAVRDGG